MKKLFYILFISFLILFKSSIIANAQDLQSTQEASIIDATQEATLNTLPIELINQNEEISTSEAQTIIEPEIITDESTDFFSAKVKQNPNARILKNNLKSNEKLFIVVSEVLAKDVNATLYNVDGQEVEVKVEEVSDSDPAIFRISPPINFKPGRYRLKIEDRTGVISTQEFTWGVLAINTNKSIYLPDETAKIAIAVLDETGNMVCDAKVSLDITDPTGNVSKHSTETNSIKVNPECYIKAFTLNPDYEARYQTGESGDYKMVLTAVTNNGTYSINDNFEVRNSVPFDVERITATRIFPPVNYPVGFRIKANQDFEGVIEEYVPDSFQISHSEGLIPYNEIRTVIGEPISNKEEFLIPNIRLPFNSEQILTQGFGALEKDPLLKAKYQQYGVIGHDGIDFDLAEGTEVVSVGDGTVARARESYDYGTTIVIQHDWGKSYYGHLSQLNIEEGHEVKEGQVIGLSGNTGLSTAAHLHFGIKPNDNDSDNGYYGKINPMVYMNDLINENEQNPTYITRNNPQASYQVLTWKVSLKKGDQINIGYQYLAPPESPQLYLLGPLTFKDGLVVDLGTTAFRESRQWQIAVDADGSGANSVSPTSGSIGGLQQTFTFTFDPSEAMDSGGITIQEPTANDWTVPQGTAGSAGYTVAAGTGNATVARVVSNADSATGWTEDDTDMCSDSFGLDTVVFKEGTGSIACVNDGAGTTDPDDGDSFGFDISAENWTNYSQLGFWARSTTGLNAGEYNVGYDNNNTCASPLEEIAGAALSANTWTYQTASLGVARTSVTSYCFLANHATALDSNKFYIDDILIGPGVATFSGTSPWIINVRFLDLAAADTVTVTYGSGGGASGVTNSATVGTHTFTTQSKVLTDGTYTNISSSPTVTLSAGPTTDQQMRHGKWFSGGAESSFTF